MAFNPTLRHLTTRLDGGVVWAASTEYLADNVVIYLDASYRCLVNHTAGSSFVTDLLANKWVKLSASEINYIANSSALVDTSGYSAYADAAGAAPVDGAGGSPSVTFTRSTTSPLRGIADFNFTKPAGASHQGNGVSYDFTIDNADLAKVLTVTFDYEVVSGTYADGDLTVYIIQDPTGTPVVIQPAGYTIMAGTAGTKLREIATFQTASNVTSYRLCFHCASSTNTSAYVIAMDNISVSPQTTVQGAAISDWVTVTAPALTASISNPTTSASGMRYRRVGDSAEIQWVYTFSGAGSGTYRFPMPSGLVLDSTKMASVFGAPTGGGRLYDSSGNVNFNLTARYDNAATGYITMTADGASVFTNTTPLAIASPDEVWVSVIVPISGWSSNTVLSQDTDTRVVAARVAGNATGTIATTFASSTALNFGGAQFDSHGSWSGSAYIVPVSGNYRITGLQQINAASGQTNLGIGIFVGASLVRESIEYGAAATADTVSFSHTLNNLNAGDQISFRAISNGTTPITAGGVTVNNIYIERLSGPATIAASESVNCKYGSASGYTLGNVDGVIFSAPTKIFDSHSAYNPATGYLVPVSGKYLVNMNFVTQTYGTASTIVSRLQLNGVSFAVGLLPIPALAGQWSRGVTGTVNANAGDIIKPVMFSTAGSPALTVNTFDNYIEFIRVGN